MTENSDDTTKLVIFGISALTILAVLYFVYKDRNKIAIPRQMPMPNSKYEELGKIEQKLMQLETKLDNFSIKQQTQQLKQPQEPERTVVSMGKSRKQSVISNMRNTNTKELFDMI